MNSDLLHTWFAHNTPQSKTIPAFYQDICLLSMTELDHELIKMTDAYTGELFGSCMSVDDESVVFSVSRLIVDPES